MERYERKNKGNPQRTPRSRFTMFPSLRGEMDWWNIDLHLLSLFPQKYARIMGGIEEEGQAIQSQQMEEKEAHIVASSRRKKGYSYPSPSKNMIVGVTYTSSFRSQTDFFRPRPPFFGQKSGPPYWQVAPLESATGPAFSGPPKLAEISKQKW
jgi:hypothetical protein